MTGYDRGTQEFWKITDVFGIRDLWVIDDILEHNMFSIETDILALLMFIFILLVIEHVGSQLDTRNIFGWKGVLGPLDWMRLQVKALKFLHPFTRGYAVVRV